MKTRFYVRVLVGGLIAAICGLCAFVYKQRAAISFNEIECQAELCYEGYTNADINVREKSLLVFHNYLEQLDFRKKNGRGALLDLLFVEERLARLYARSDKCKSNQFRKRLSINVIALTNLYPDAVDFSEGTISNIVTGVDANYFRAD